MNMSTPTFASVDITPSKPAALAGYAARSGSYSGVAEPLEANLMIARSPDGEPAVFCAIDTLFVDDALRHLVAKQAQMAPEKLIFVASHTHNGPALSDATPGLGKMCPAYFDLVAGRLAREIRSAASGGGATTTVSCAETDGRYAVNRRRRAWVFDYQKLKRERSFSFSRRIALAANPRGVSDNRLRVWKFTGSTGAAQAVLWSLAAHPAFYPHSEMVSADFPGTVRALVRASLGRDIPMLFCPGLAGSAIPDIPSSLPRSGKEWFMRLLPFFPVLPAFTVRSYDDYCRRVANDIIELLDKTSAGSPVESVTISNDRTLPIFTDISGDELDVCVSSISFGETRVVVMSGEPVGEWQDRLGIDPSILVTGYGSGRPLYVPTPEQLPDGGYEVVGFQKPFGFNGVFEPDLDRRLQEALDRVLPAGRPAPSDEPETHP